MTTTLTASLDRKVFISRSVAFMSRHEINLLDKLSDTSSTRLNRVLGDVARYAKYNEEDGLPRSYHEACYGIQWSVQTMRLSAVTEIALRAMKVRELLVLIHEVQQSCKVMGEVPDYLDSRFARGI
jgi:hypothetical protein